MSGKIAKVLCASVLTSSLLGISIVANAADMPLKAPPAPAPVPPPFSWTGFYIGGNVGAAWSDRRVTDTRFGLDFMNQGNDVRFIGGGQVGANYQINNFVIGVEADFDFASNHDNDGGGVLIAGNTFRAHANDTFITTVAGRIGYAFDHVLLYGKGGGGWISNNGLTVINTTTGAAFTTGNTNTDSGWLAGGGIEWAFAENWSARVEYDFLGLNDRTLTVPLGVPVIGGDVFTLHNRNVQMATFGVNYRLNWFFNNPSNAVATRY
jgi:outer membrane immunogenic protein